VNAVVLLALLFSQQRNEAEEIFRKLEEKLLKAGTVQVAFKATFEQQKDQRTVTGLMNGAVLLEGDKARLEVEGQGASEVRSRIVSDGKTTVLTAPPSSESVSTATSPTLRRDAALFLTRTGTVSAVMQTQRKLRQGGEASSDAAETDPRAKFRVTEFKTGPATKIDGRDVGAIQYVVEEADTKSRRQVTLWIDTVTMLPVRRRVTEEEKGVVIEEAYGVFKVDEKIDPTKFEHSK
jgi:outer membrane lipoprotein-sorting protein